MKRLSKKFKIQRVAEGTAGTDFNPNLYNDPETGENVKIEVVQEAFDSLNWTAHSEYEPSSRSNDYYIPDESGVASLEAEGKGSLDKVETKFGKLIGYDFDNLMYALETDESLESEVKDVMKGLADFPIGSFNVSLNWSVNQNGITCKAEATDIQIDE